MKIYIASDHAGFEMKAFLKSYFSNTEYEFVDLGPTYFDPTDDYTDFVSKVADKVSKEENVFGVVIGYSGQGEAMVCNRFKNVRCALYYGGEKSILRLSREHNNANVLSFGANFISNDEAKEALLFWVKTAFSGEERHKRRVREIEEY